MPKDATPEKITLVDDNFVNDNHRHIAEIIKEEWDPSTPISKFAEKYEPHKTTFRSVYRRYFGVPEEEFNDGIEDPRTIDQIRDQYGSYTEYRELRERGRVEIPSTEDNDDAERVTESEMELIQEGYRRGYADGFKDGMEQND